MAPLVRHRRRRSARRTLSASLRRCRAPRVWRAWPPALPAPTRGSTRCPSWKRTHAFTCVFSRKEIQLEYKFPRDLPHAPSTPAKRALDSGVTSAGLNWGTFVSLDPPRAACQHAASQNGARNTRQYSNPPLDPPLHPSSAASVSWCPASVSGGMFWSQVSFVLSFEQKARKEMTQAT